MSTFIDVQVGQDLVTVDYRATALVLYPVHIAAAAIEQQERYWLLQNMTNAVLNQIAYVFTYDLGPVRPIYDQLESLRLNQDYPEMTCNPGEYVWQFDLICDECSGCGVTTTTSGREVDCPCCAGCGFTFTFSIFTDSDGKFTGFPPRPVWQPALADFTDYGFQPLPLDEALESVRAA